MDTAGGHQSKYLSFDDQADEAWTDLTSSRYAPLTGPCHPTLIPRPGNHVRLSEEDLLAINQTSVPLGSGGYLGMLGVYHELHCVVSDAKSSVICSLYTKFPCQKWIRWALNQSKYQDSLSDHDRIDLPAHISMILRINTQHHLFEYVLNHN